MPAIGDGPGGVAMHRRSGSEAQFAAASSGGAVPARLLPARLLIVALMSLVAIAAVAHAMVEPGGDAAKAPAARLSITVGEPGSPQRVVMPPDGLPSTEAATALDDSVISRDGAWRARIVPATADPKSWSRVIEVSRTSPDGAAPSAPAVRSQPFERIRRVEFLPDGSGLLALHDSVDGSRVELRRFTRQGERFSSAPVFADGRAVTSFAVAGNGRIAVAVAGVREGKIVLNDLVVLLPDSERTLRSRVPITAMAWDASGTRLAFSGHGAITLVGVEGVETRSIELSTLDARLAAYHADSIAWSPCGTMLAMTLRFSGGTARAFGDPQAERTPMFGVREVFLVRLEANESTAGEGAVAADALKVLTLDRYVRSVTWLDAAGQ